MDSKFYLFIVLCMKQVLLFLNDIFDTLLKALSDPSDEVICSSRWLFCLPDGFMELHLMSCILYYNLKALQLFSIFFWNSSGCTIIC